MPSLGKILVAAAILVAVWVGFRLIGRLDRERRAAVKAANEAHAKAARRGGERKSVSDLTECGTCHAFVPPGRVCSACGAALKA